jgi:hypothetical protein
VPQSKFYVSQLNSLCHSDASIETLRLSTHLSLSFRRYIRNFTSLNSSLSSIQVLQSKLYVSQLISPPFKCSNWNYMSIHSSLSFFFSCDSDTKIFYSDFIVHMAQVQQLLSNRPPSNHHYIKYLSQRGNKAFTLESKISMSNVCSQEVRAWFNVGIFYKSLASQVLLKVPKNV